MILMVVVCLLSKLTSSRWNKRSKMAIEGGQSFLRFTYQLEGVGRIPRVAHVFLELTLNV
jgi:hypothetical protein